MNNSTSLATNLVLVKAIAALALVVLSFGISLGNYWFTFGLWPRSWVSFVGFAAASLTVTILLTVVGSLKDSGGRE